MGSMVVSSLRKRVRLALSQKKCVVEESESKGEHELKLESQTLEGPQLELPVSGKNIFHFHKHPFPVHEGWGKKLQCLAVPLFLTLLLGLYTRPSLFLLLWIG